MRQGQAVLQYDLSRSAGWALYAPDRAAPRHGILRLPPTRTDGSAGPMFHLLFEHISWADRNFGGLRHIGYEAFIAPTGGKKDKGKGFITSPKTQKILIGLIATVELCATILKIEALPLNNSSWRRYWVGSQKRGTTRERWKQLSVAKAMALGWAPEGDDDADAIGQLHLTLHRLGITPPWDTHAERDLITLMMAKAAAE